MKTGTGTVEGLYIGHGEWLAKWLERRLRCPDRAADLSHDTFCRLLERLPEVTPASPRSLLATIARRLMVDDIRRREIERSVIECFALHNDDTYPITPERILEAIRFLDEVLKVLGGLPSITRQVLLLRRVDGLSQEEIASKLNLSTRTVRRHIVSASVQIFSVMAD
ncbi:sigma-70 family RNA polymerase sigma factor [Asticcacaulis endophyticus]|uniref:RNA polymerase sigma factor n=1 Tax=Asticcacaulis endophyticus TaxID=1395890 RepID=A0A918Q9K3_9CAUL|nr:sigma-70 family RNA polymerase sigma factor [Asticcacaulis endophyticus]GGZ39059.1 RNA polymerase sigma factor [Asticcacaulis endophyticus]